MVTSLQRFLNRIAYIAPGGYSLRPSLHRRRGVKMGRNVWISLYVYMDELHPEVISIGDNCTIGLRTSIFTHFYWGPRRTNDGFKPVTIGANTFIGPHCVILPGVNIGEGCVIKAGSVLTRNVPPGMFMGPPNPEPLGRVTVPLTPLHEYDEFLKGLQPLPRAGAGSQPRPG
jgi:acetyltransferase-like isoleucine patch superfamily enzyme